MKSSLPMETAQNPTSRRKLVFGYSALVGILLVLSLARQGFANAFDTFMAEDGNIFYSQATMHSVGYQFTHVYAGYLHTGPRIVALLATFVPLAWAAAFDTVGAALVTALLAAVVYAASGSVLQSRWARVVVSCGLLLLPVLRLENVNDIMNFQWSLFYVTFWVLVWRQQTTAQKTVAFIVVLLMTLSQPLSIVFAPLYCVRLFLDRRRFTVGLGGAFAFGWIVQAIAVERQSQRATFQGTLDRSQIMHGYVHDAFHGVFPDAGWLSDGSVGRVVLVAGLIVSIITGIVLIRKAKKFAFPIAAIAMSVLIYFGPVVGGSEVAPRYLVAPALLILAAIVYIIDAIPSRYVRYAAAGWLTAMLIVGWSSTFSVSSFRNTGPTWSSEVSWAKQTCKGQPAKSDIVLLTVPPPWYVTLQCDYVNKN